MFGTVLTLACTLLQLYVFARAATVPVIARTVPRRTLVIGGAAMWLAFVVGRSIGHGGSSPLAAAAELFAMTWMASLFLVAVCLLAVDLVTAFGHLLPRIAPRLRGWALAGGAGLSLVALVQGIRPPVIAGYEVRLAGLPAELDGTVLVAMSDLHLGTLLGERWLAARIAQVEAERPDIVVLLGDVVEGHGRSPAALVPVLRALTAPLGVWAVAGNHESHGTRDAGARLLESAGIAVLHDRWVEVRPGLIVAGVDDLTSLRSRHIGGDPIGTALAGRPPGATVLLSHTPWEAERAAAEGVGLMLCGHTHGGQIWPFSYLVATVYPLLGGRTTVAGMPVIVCRGTGTWGPRMRLWRPGEILRVTLRSGGPA